MYIYQDTYHAMMIYTKAYTMLNTKVYKRLGILSDT